MVKFGIHLFLWAERLDDSSLPLIAKAKKMGFDGVEIPLMELDAINIAKTRRELEKHGMQCAGSLGLTADMDVASKDEKIRRRGIEHMKRCAEVIAELGGDSINGVLYTTWGKITGKSRTTEEWQRSVESLKEICRHAKKYNVMLGLEAINRFETYFLNTAADAVKLAGAIGEPNAKVHLDTFHMNIEEKNFYDPVKETGDFLGHLHCCENDRGVPGTGHVNWDEFFKAVSEIGYDRWLVIESFVPESEKMAAATAIWRKIAPSADAIASDGLKFLKGMAKKYL